MRHTRIVVTHYGGPDELRVVHEERPEPQDGEVRVRMLAAGAIGFRSFRSTSSLSSACDFRAVYCWRLASPGAETGGSLQHPVA